MTTAQRLDVVLLWHMHQPDYRDPVTGEFRLPWALLHALKDYADMAAHLEAQPRMRAVVNFVPVLLDQLDDYADQCATGRYRDPLLAALARPAGQPFDADERQFLLAQCFAANHERMIAPFPAYAHLRDLARLAGEGDIGRYLSDAFCDDLLVWYLLAWTGETVRRGSPLVQALMTRGRGFGVDDRHALLAEIGRVVRGLCARYRALEEAGTIELATSPAQHPIGPLLLDFGCAREARPGLPLPQRGDYPGGAARLAQQVADALSSHERRFGRRPAGLWPPEGAVSNAFVHEIAHAGIGWFASGSQVLDHSLAHAKLDVPPLGRLRGWTVATAAAPIAGFFRDDRLSDLIGFEYRRWHGSDAVAHFVRELEALAQPTPEGGTPPLATIIVDGENAWEYYPYNGFWFLSELYATLVAHPVVRPRTFRDVLATRRDVIAAGGADAFGRLPALVAGSWVYGDLTTWIGSPDKNRAWELLVDAKRACDEAVAGGRVDPDTRARLARQLAVCESSDWYWWFGDYHPAESVAAFDRLFRINLARIYALLGTPTPEALDVPVSRGNTTSVQQGAIMRATA
jgi:alpha-amylase/alpha-mannosidase (GH57 family)